MLPRKKKPADDSSNSASTPPAAPAPPAAPRQSSPMVVQLPSLQPDLSALLGSTSHREPLLVADFFREKVQEWMALYVQGSLQGDLNNGFRDQEWSKKKRNIFAKRVNDKVQDACKESSTLETFAGQVQFDVSGPWAEQQARYGDVYDLWFTHVTEYQQTNGKPPPMGVFEKTYLTRCFYAAGHLAELGEIFQISTLKRAQSGHPILAERFDLFKTAFNFIYNGQSSDNKTGDDFLAALREVKPRTDKAFMEFFMPMQRKGVLPGKDMLSNMYNQMFDDALKLTISEFCAQEKEKKEKRIRGTYAARLSHLFTIVLNGSGKVATVASNVAHKAVEKGLDLWTGSAEQLHPDAYLSESDEDDDSDYGSDVDAREEEAIPMAQVAQGYNPNDFVSDYVVPPAVITTHVDNDQPLINLDDEYTPTAPNTPVTRPSASTTTVLPGYKLLRSVAEKQKAEDENLIPRILSQVDSGADDSSDSEEELDAIAATAAKNSKTRFVRGSSQ